MNIHTKNTKIIATISDIRCDVDFLKQLHDNGMNIVRINTAHATFEGALKVIENTRKVSNSLAIVMDVKGVEIRTNISEPVEVKTGQEVVFVNKNPKPGQICTNCPNFVDLIPLNVRILVQEGDFVFYSKEKTAEGLVCVSHNEGVIENKKHINVPDQHLDLPSLTEKDKKFVDIAIEQNLDYVAHSFVRGKKDLDELKNYMLSKGKVLPIISKIENREGVENIEEIIDNCEVIMVARGDLGVELKWAEIPWAQKMMIRKCLDRAKPVIVATQMLESMMEKAQPLKAEISDIANAILDGTSAIMLSGETTKGKHPVASVRLMSDIALELHDKPRQKISVVDSVKKDSILLMAKSVVEVGLEIGAKAIIVPTRTGRSARYLSALRSRIPIYALCYDPSTLRQMAILHGVRGIEFEKCESVDELVRKSVNLLHKQKYVEAEDTVIVLSGDPKLDPLKSVVVEILKVKDKL